MVREQANAKINLFLDVNSKRADGFHNIKSVMHSVTLADSITVSASEADATEISVHTDSNELASDKGNLVYRSAEKYLAKLEKNARVNITLEKRIPIGAGLAGGSADAAATLRALNRIFNLATKEQLLEIAAEIGSDVPFCLLGGTALCEGRGEIMTPLEPAQNMHFVIAIGRERVSTPEAYRALDSQYPDGFPDESKRCKRLIASLKNELDFTSLYNVFEDVIKLPEIEKIKEILIKSKAESALMSGSGPSVFGIFNCAAKARNAKDELIKAGFDAYYATSALNGETI